MVHLCSTPLAYNYYLGKLFTHEPNLFHLGRSRACVVGSTPSWPIVRAHEELVRKARTWQNRRPPLLQRRIHTSCKALPPYRDKLPRLLWVRGAQEKARRLQVHTNPPVWLDGPWQMVVPHCFPASVGSTRWPASQLLGLGGSPPGNSAPADGTVPLEMDSAPADGQSPWRPALTRWPQSCPCPSPHSSGRGQPSLQAAPRHSNNNPPGS